MNHQQQGLTIKDFEDAVAAAVDHLFIMYKNNGGDETTRTFKVLVENMERLTPYMSELAELVIDSTSDLKSSQAKAIIDKLKPVIEVIKG